jgi:hypothetical protein
MGEQPIQFAMTDYMDRSKRGDDGPAVVLSGTSPIQVKFIGWLVLVCAGGFGGWIWWASAMSTKLDVVIVNQSSQLLMVKDITEDVSRLKEWRIQIDTVGSPTMVQRLNSAEKQMIELQKAFALHLALTTDRGTELNKP